MKRFDEALAEIRRALELDPLSVIMNRIYADILVDGRRFDEAIRSIRKPSISIRTFPLRTFSLGARTSERHVRRGGGASRVREVEWGSTDGVGEDE